MDRISRASALLRMSSEAIEQRRETYKRGIRICIWQDEEKTAGRGDGKTPASWNNARLRCGKEPWPPQKSIGQWGNQAETSEGGDLLLNVFGKEDAVSAWARGVYVAVYRP